MSTVVAESAQSNVPSKDLKKLAGIALSIFLLVGLAFSVLQNMALNGRVADLENGLSEAQGELHKALASSDTSLTNQVESLELQLNDVQAVNSTQFSTIGKDTKQLSKQVALINDCLPEIQDQMQSFEVSFGYAYPEQYPSRYCNSLLYGTYGTESTGD